MEAQEQAYILLFVFIFILGGGVTIIYYFFRYYFRTHEKDEEVVSTLKKKSEEVDVVKESAEEPITSTPPRAEKPKTKDLQSALANTKDSLFGRLKGVFTSDKTLSDDDIESLEEILYTCDLGPLTVQRLLERVGEKLNTGDKSDLSKVVEALRTEMMSIFTQTEENTELIEKLGSYSRPTVIFIVGVNGAGKTTTIGKLAYKLARQGNKVLVAAGDTFRAAAGEQLKEWSDRAQVEIFNPKNVKDPSAVAFDAVSTAQSKNYDFVILDTAGRLHTQDHLMEELKKVKRVVQKIIPESPHETLIVLDANSGQNALIQAKSFNQALDLTGAVLTKLDGTAKGGVAVGLAYELQLPIKVIGIGEGIEDLRSFKSEEFVNSIL